MGMMTSVFPVFFFIIFFAVFGFILYTIIRGLAQSRKNAASPRITAPARLVAKRTAVSSYRSSNAGNTSMSHTTHTTHYYVAFEFESGDRMEFAVPDEFYGLSVEGDSGKLTFRGTEFLSFERT